MAAPERARNEPWRRPELADVKVVLVLLCIAAADVCAWSSRLRQRLSCLKIYPGACGRVQGVVMGLRVGRGLGDDVCELVVLFWAWRFNGSSAGRWSWCSGETLPGVWGAGPLQRGEFERGIPLSCCRPGKALFIPYNSVLYKKGRPHRPVMNTGGRPGANRPGFSRFAFCIRSSYTVGAPAAISRRNAPRVIKSARAGNAVDVRAAMCAEYVDALRRRRGVDVGSGGRLRLCALVGPGGLSVPGGCGRRAYSRRRPEQAQTPVQKHAQNWD